LLSSLEEYYDGFWSDDNLKDVSDINFKFFLFSDGTEKHHENHAVTGTKFSKFVVDNGLGIISSSAIRVNPNSGNRIRIWIWDINRHALLKWYKENKQDDGDDDEEP
jgi:hypothetical protein